MEEDKPISNGDSAPAENGHSSPVAKKTEEPTYVKDAEEFGTKKYPYPKSVFFIVINEFCERFSYYGMRAVLTLYLKNVLGFSENSATSIYHAFTAFVYFTPVFGAMLADSLLGKFKTIFILSIVYAIGNIVLAAAAVPTFNLPGTAITMIGLALIAIGTGGIKPCVSAFGGDQFKVPEQQKQLQQFFSLFYFAINGGSLLSTFVTPIFRKDISCYGDETCYSLAFAVPAGLFIVSIVVFVLGRPLYIIKEPAGNIVLKVAKAISHALGRKRKNKGVTKEHWLDHADDKYDQRFLDDCKIMLRVLFLYIPLPVFWALFDQQGSRWTFQATRMDGVTFGYTFKPDQVQVINPALILIFIPIFEKGIYPLFGKFGLLKKPLQRLGCAALGILSIYDEDSARFIGGCMAGFAFIIAGILELQIEDTLPVELTGQETNINIINTLPCNFLLKLNEELEEIPLNINSNHDFKQIPQSLEHHIKLSLNQATEQPDPIICANFERDIQPLKLLVSNATEAMSYMLGIAPDAPGTGIDIMLYNPQSQDDYEKSGEGYPKIKIIMSPLIGNKAKNISVYIYDEKEDDTYIFDILSHVNATMADKFFYQNFYTPEDADDELINEEVEPKKYSMKLRYLLPHEDDGEDAEFNEVTYNEIFDLKLGGSYIFHFTLNNPYDDFHDNKTIRTGMTLITEPNSIHMTWLFPQYIVITLGEVMFSITGLEFSYSQAPVSMKSVMQSAWLLSVAFGNIIVIIIAEAQFFKEQSKEFFLFAGLMLADMILFSYMAYKYVPADLGDPNAPAQKKKDDDD